MVDVVLHLVVLRQAEQVAVLHVHQILGLLQDILKESVSIIHIVIIFAHNNPHLWVQTSFVSFWLGIIWRNGVHIKPHSSHDLGNSNHIRIEGLRGTFKILICRFAHACYRGTRPAPTAGTAGP